MKDTVHINQHALTKSGETAHAYLCLIAALTTILQIYSTYCL